MIKESSDVFHIWFLSFDDRTDPMDKFVPDVVDDEHLVLSLLDLSLEVRLDVRVMVDGGQCAHMQVFLERSVGHWMYSGLTENGRAGSIFKGDDTTVTGQLPGVIVTGEEVGEYGQMEGGDLPDSGHGGGKADGLVEPVVGEHEFLDFGLDPFDLVVKGLVDALEVGLGKLPEGGTEEFQFVRVLVHVCTCVDQFPSHFEQDLDPFEYFGHRSVEFHFPMVLGGVNGNAFGIDLVVLSPLYPDAPKDLDGHLDTEVGLFLYQFGDDGPTVYTGMLETYKRVVQVDFLVSEQSDKGIGSFFGVFEHIRGSPVIFDDGQVEESFRYVDTDKAREGFFVHNE